MDILSLTSALILFYIFYNVILVIYVRFVRAPTSFAKYKGEWAVVTGASYGIGAALAKALAKRGLNVAVLARSKEKLQQVTDEINRLYPSVQTRIITADFLAKDEDALYASIQSQLQDLTVSILINNVGGTAKVGDENLFKEYYTYSVEDERDIFKINVVTTERMTRLVLNGMIERKKGAIINISSTASLVTPYLAIYGSDKAKINALSTAWHFEFKKHNIDVQAIITGVVQTAATQNFSSSADGATDSDSFAESVLNLFTCYGPIIVPYWTHAIQAFSAEAVPLSIRVMFSTMTLGKLRKSIDANLLNKSKSQ